MPATKVREPIPSPAELGIKVGDFFVSSWGYNQTNIDFYRVVGVLPKSVRLQKWSSKVVRSEGQGHYMVPGDGPQSFPIYQDSNDDFGWRRERVGYEEAPIQTKRVRAYGPNNQHLYITLTSYSSASPWSGEARYETDSLYGH